jgi:hypothetical protein
MTSNLAGHILYCITHEIMSSIVMVEVYTRVKNSKCHQRQLILIYVH